MLSFAISLIGVLSLTSASSHAHPASMAHPRIIAPVLVRDTGAISPVLLTPAALAAYTPVWKELWSYLRADPALLQVVNAHRSGKVHVLGNLQGHKIATTVSAPNYATLAQQDTSVAALFAKYHMDPAQFAQTQFSVRVAIVSVLWHARLDTTTTIGKNMVFVQTHRQDLTTDWQQQQAALDALMRINAQMLNHAQGNTGAADDLTP